jgi:hypothetical protein
VLSSPQTREGIRVGNLATVEEIYEEIHLWTFGDDGKVVRMRH